MEPGGTSVADYEIHSLAPGQLSPKPIRFKSLRWSQELWELFSPPYNTLLGKSPGVPLLAMAQAAGKGHRMFSEGEQCSTVLQFMLPIHQSLGLEGRKENLQFLADEDAETICYWVYVAGVQSSKKNSEILWLFLLKTKQPTHKPCNLLNWKSHTNLNSPLYYFDSGHFPWAMGSDSWRFRKMEPFGMFFRELSVTVTEDLQVREQSGPICLSGM